MQSILQRHSLSLIALLVFCIAIITASSAFTWINTSQNLTLAYQHQLSILKNTLHAHLTAYFTHQNKLAISIASLQTTQNALTDFHQAFTHIDQSLDTQSNQLLQQALLNYLTKTKRHVPNAPQQQSLDFYLPQNDGAQWLQAHYIPSAANLIPAKSWLANIKKTSYKQVHENYQRLFRSLQQQHDFHDILLIDNEGNIVYSITKEFDFATNLLNGPYSSSPLAQVYKQASNLGHGQTSFSDFKPYEPSYNQAAAFIASPVYHHGKKIGVAAFQLSIEAINQAATMRFSHQAIGLGNSGEAYLVGSDYYMRSDSRFIKKIENNPLVHEFNTTVGIIKAESEATRKALNGENGFMRTFDYRGKEVFSAYMPLDFLDAHWALMVEIDTAEVYAAINDSIYSSIIGNAVILLFCFILLSYLAFRLLIKPVVALHSKLYLRIKHKNKKIITYRNLMEAYKQAVSLSSIISRTDINGKIVQINDAFCESSGYSNEELIGKSHNIVRHPETPKTVFIDMWQVILHQKKPWQGLLINKNKSGMPYYLNSTILPVLDHRHHIEEFISINQDITNLIESRNRLRRQTTNQKTGLPNLIKLEEDLNTLNKVVNFSLLHISTLIETRDYSSPEAYLEILEAISDSIKHVVIAQGFSLYQINDEDFAILDSQTSDEHAYQQQMKNLIHHFDHHVISLPSGRFNLTMTIGIAFGMSKQVLSDSRMALRKALENGEALLSFGSDNKLKKQYLENIAMTTRIKEAIIQDRVHIFIQPIVPLKEGSPTKFECLVRIKEGNDYIYPINFLETAKRARLFPTITQVVINKACEHFKDNQHDFSINLSINDVLNPEIIALLRTNIIKHQLGSRLTLELLESELIDDFGKVHKNIQVLRSLGCKVAIDDFGSGYSNFQYLAKLDIDFIKIDGTLISDIITNENSQIIVELITEFAKHQNIKTIAEYVHNESVLNIVKQLDVDYAQGYFLGKPRPLDK